MNLIEMKHTHRHDPKNITNTHALFPSLLFSLSLSFSFFLFLSHFALQCNPTHQIAGVVGFQQLWSHRVRRHADTRSCRTHLLLSSLTRCYGCTLCWQRHHGCRRRPHFVALVRSRRRRVCASQHHHAVPRVALVCHAYCGCDGLSCCARTLSVCASSSGFAGCRSVQLACASCVLVACAHHGWFDRGACTVDFSQLYRSDGDSLVLVLVVVVCSGHSDSRRSSS